MKKFEVQVALEAVAEARSAWGAANRKFQSDLDGVMARLLNEAARNYMSITEVAKAAGLTTARVRSEMRKVGLNPKNGRTLLAKTASEALSNNAALLGIEPHEMDLTSPLAYLPMGSQMKAFLETERAEIEAPEDRLIKIGRLTPCAYCDAVEGEYCDTPGGGLHPSRRAMAELVVNILDALEDGL